MARPAASARWGARFAVAVLLAALACSAAAQGAIARLERIEGGGVVQVGSLSDAALLQAAAAGELTIGTLVDRGLTPNWVLTALFNLEVEGVAARDHTLARLTVLVPTTTANLDAMRTSMAALEAALPSAPEAERRSYRETLDAFARSEGVLEDLRRLLGFMESRAYLAWVDVAPGHLLQAGQTIRVGGDAVAVVRTGSGALVQVRGGSTLEVAPQAIARPAAADVAAVLWRGIADFYFPPGGEHAVRTARALVRVRGTEFRVGHEDGVTQVTVSSGVVEVIDETAATPVRLAAGEAQAFGGAAASDAADPLVGAQGPTVAGVAGGREVFESGVRVVVPETWPRAPGLALWWTGEDPEDPWAIVAFADLSDFDADRDLGDAVVAQAPAVLGGQPATRYDLRWQDAGFAVFARYLVLDAPLPDGRRLVLTGLWRDTHPYEAEVLRFLASARFEGVVGGSEVARAAATAPLVGVWRIDANGSVGTLTLTRTGAGWAATLDLAWGDEPMRDVAFDGGELRFVRPLGADTQAYVGRLAPDAAPPRLEGTFDQGGADAYLWRAERIGDAAGVDVAAGVADAVHAPPDAPIQLLEGGWRVDANGYPGTLTFVRTSAGWSGVLNRQEAPEELVDVTFDGAEVRFVRPLGAYTQGYVGRLERDGASWRLSGTFDQGGAGAYLWHATRPVDPDRALAGAWRVDLNGYGGMVTFEPAAGDWTATLVLAGGDPEALTDVTFDGAEVHFVRPLGELTQSYWGVFDRDAASVRLHGRFGYGAIEGYRWWAERERGPDE